MAADGAVEISSLDDRRGSGPFRVTVRHIPPDHRGRIAGAVEPVAVVGRAAERAEQKIAEHLGEIAKLRAELAEIQARQEALGAG